VDRREKQELMARLERDALRICARFRLAYRVLEPERANVKRRYGVCFSDGTIRIRLMHATTRRPLKYSSLVNTLCHELAHLRHFNHGARFQAFYAQILEWARREGIYRPSVGGPRRAPDPRPQSTGRTAVLVQIQGGGHAATRAGAADRAASSGRPSPPATVQLELFG
jgi:hypothetical protein